jgi:ribosome-binding protein aMBF1 (putative translation factor)
MTEYIDPDWITVTYNKNYFKKNIVNKKESITNIINENKNENENQQTMITKEYGLKIKQARLSLKLSQRDLANKLNININIINDYENGYAVSQNYIISKINKYLNII